jgi:hypothetical protein
VLEQAGRTAGRSARPVGTRDRVLDPVVHQPIDDRQCVSQRTHAAGEVVRLVGADGCGHHEPDSHKANRDDDA